MSDPVLIAMPGQEPLGESLATAVGAETGAFESRRFPDGESYFRYDVGLAGRAVVLLWSLDRPDPKFLPLVFAAATARELGAGTVGLVAPYLAYMRQDRRFREGEAVTSTHFARLLGGEIDWLVTVDPHLHRRASLSEIYSIPTAVLHAAPLISDWIREQVERPVLIGPDAESAQWVAAVARGAGAPYVVLEKTRRGDREVSVSVPDVGRWSGHTPVLVDDIVSTARTMIETVGHLRRAGMQPPVCIAVHGLFAGNAVAELGAAGAARIVTTNTVRHESNRLDVSGLLADGVRAMLGAERG